jgi:phospholipid/cholesterol/gamma-HCH transport system ATP-binding protein
MADKLNSRSEQWQIRVRDLHKSFGTQHVLRGVNLDIERRKINIIIGGSGQGKSVLMKHLMGLLAPDSGHIFIDGQDIIGLGDVVMGKIRRKFGMVFQYAALFDSMSVVENIAFPLLERYRLPKAEVMERIRALLTKLDLASTAGIEQKFPAEFGVTSVVISHDMASTFRIADRVAMLYEGIIVASGTRTEVLAAPPPVLREFVEPSGAVHFGGGPLTQPTGVPNSRPIAAVTAIASAPPTVTRNVARTMGAPPR